MKIKEWAQKLCPWSQLQIKDYSSLQKISQSAWEIIGATFPTNGTNTKNKVASQDGATAPITERLLRSILSLKPAHQLTLVSQLAAGNITKFKSQANALKLRENLYAYCHQQLGNWKNRKRNTWKLYNLTVSLAV